MYTRLGDLVDQVIDLVLADTSAQPDAQAVGVAVAGLYYLQPESLAVTCEVLIQGFLDNLPDPDRQILCPRLLPVLTSLAVGFCRQSQQTVLHEQDRIRSALERTLRQREQHLRTLLTNVPVILFTIDPDGTITLTEGKGLDALGLVPTDRTGKSVFTTDLLYPPAREDVQRALNGETVATTIQVSGRTLDLYYAPIIGTGTSHGIIGVAVDITERAQAEAELVHMRQRLAERVEQEHLRLARDLHDSVVQHLVAFSYRLLALQSRVSDPAVVQECIALHQHILETVTLLRQIIGELRPAGLDDLGLTAALDGYVARVRREQGAAGPAIRLALDSVGPDVPPALARTLFRIAQEALRNALQHAAARTIQITLQRTPDAIRLQVQDDGQGFVLPASIHRFADTNHFGLIGMAEQIRLIKGTLDIQSHPGQGTQITVQIPLHEEPV
jgi:PAS domain S-box-containing protein